MWLTPRHSLWDFIEASLQEFACGCTLTLLLLSRPLPLLRHPWEHGRSKSLARILVLRSAQAPALRPMVLTVVLGGGV